MKNYFYLILELAGLLLMFGCIYFSLIIFNQTY